MMNVDLTKYISELERVPCNACGGSNEEVFGNEERFGLPLKSVICRNCGLMYLNPRPTSKLYKKFNESDYRRAVSGTDEGVKSIFDRQVRHTKMVTIPFFEKHSGLIRPESLLDIGCSYGGIAAGFGKKYPGISLFGVEPVLKNAAFARARAGMDVAGGVFEDYAAERKFDVVIFAQAINHTLDPFVNLKKIHALLTDRGVLYMSVQDTVSALLNRPLTRMVEMTHPYMFCRESVQYLVEKAGLEIVGYRDGQLDGGELARRDIPGMAFPRMLILARKSEKMVEPEAPDFKKILTRMRRNIDFYEQWHGEIDRWHSPNLWRRAYRYLVHGI